MGRTSKRAAVVVKAPVAPPKPLTPAEAVERYREKLAESVSYETDKRTLRLSGFLAEINATRNENLGRAIESNAEGVMHASAWLALTHGTRIYVRYFAANNWAEAGDVTADAAIQTMRFEVDRWTDELLRWDSFTPRSTSAAANLEAACRSQAKREAIDFANRSLKTIERLMAAEAALAAGLTEMPSASAQ